MRTLLALRAWHGVIGEGSYPASQGEHLIAHTMEMKHGSTLMESYHGEQIGVTTLCTMAEIQEEHSFDAPCSSENPRTGKKP